VSVVESLALLATKQVYDPVAGNIYLSAIFAAIPLAVLFVLLGVLRLRAHWSAVLALLSAIVLAFFIWGMPAKPTLGATTFGLAFGLWPISWIVLNAIFLHNITIEAGAFDTFRHSLAGLTEDRRVQALIVAFAFGALIEGIAGFGAPVAITAAMMASLGFDPLYAAVLALLANTAPVAYGSIGIPITTLGNLIAPIIGPGWNKSGVILGLSQMVGRQLPVFSILIPAYLVSVMAGFRSMWKILPAVATCGISFAVVQFAVSNVVGPELTDVLAALVSLLCLFALLRFWKPAEIWRFPNERAGATAAAVPGRRGPGAMARPRMGVARAWSPYLILVVVILVAKLDTVVFGLTKHHLGGFNPTFFLTGLDTSGTVPKPYAFWPMRGLNLRFTFPTWGIKWPGLHNVMLRQPPIVPKAAPYPAIFTWDFLAAAGSVVLIAAIIAALVLGVGPGRMVAVYGRTLRQMALPFVTIACILGIANVMNYSGMTSTLALLFAKTGYFFPFFSAFVGWLGVFLSGSDTASNTLFGPMQTITAQQLHLQPVLMAATNSSGGVMGKMISPQNLSVGAAAIDRVGEEGNILRRTLGHSLILAAAVGIVAMLEAYVFTGLVPLPFKL
jgi:L-lactate permease